MSVDKPPDASGDVGRIILDASGIARWTGPAVGILRVEQALARYALSRRPDVVLSFYDKPSTSFHALNPRWAPTLVDWKGSVGRRHGTLVNLLPSVYSVVDALERWRLACGGGATARGIAAVQRFVLLGRRRRRRGIVPYRVAIGPPLRLGLRDIVLSVGSDWTNKDAIDVLELKKRFGFRYVVMCYDIIPLLFPQHFRPDDVAAFRRYWTAILPVADLILVNSRWVAADIESYCERNGIALADLRLVPLGCDGPAATVEAALPWNLETGRFIVFVSTIEPRKGHGMLMRVWQRLLAANVPQRHRFKLVFVGRRGWQVDSVFDQIDDGALFAGTLLYLAGIDDAELVALYRAAAFCVYPSQYEGFGLPVIEAFAHGKAVIASTGGALPETVGGLSPRLDPNDEDAWFATLRTWIEHPDLRVQYEAKIRTNFRSPTWEEAAAQIVASCR